MTSDAKQSLDLMVAPGLASGASVQHGGRSMKRVGLIALALVGMVGCSSGDEPGTQGQSLTVHEWGTFTSVQSSLGKQMQGLHHTDELLPSFVHARDVLARSEKGFEELPEPVTQKLETPVLYFY